MSTYNWQKSDWPHFKYDLRHLERDILAIAEKAGLISGKLSHLARQQQTETMIDLMVEEAVKTSEIEGEFINRPDIRSSIKNKLSLNPETVKVYDKRASGLADLMLNVRDTFIQPLSENMLFDWHIMLLASTTNRNIRIGCWRTDEEPMQIISGQYNNQTIHFEAPPAKDVPNEMVRFIQWFNDTAPNQAKSIHYAPVRAAIAHLYFESIHPFDDGNGRIGRAIAEKSLSQGFGYPVLLSLSRVMEADKKAYYTALNRASKSNEITHWIEYFVQSVMKAQHEVESQINFIMKKAQFFATYHDKLNERQLKVIQRILKEGTNGFEGGMSAKKYMAITNTSKATATRDLHQLVMMNIFTSIGSGRGVRYELNLG